MVPRIRHSERVRSLLARYPVVALLGARQVGKSTLARQLVREAEGPTFFFDLENPQDLARLQEPMLSLAALPGLVVLDEVQRLPGLFETLRVLADRPGPPARFLVLGSASPELLRQSSESLAGRIFYHELKGFALDEIGTDSLEALWLRGGFPRSFLAGNDAESFEWRVGFIRTFLERDLPQLDVRIPSPALRRFWSMIAHYHGQVCITADLKPRRFCR
ncbi:MAG: AAA family ATPase [Thermodesulfobacteriota bacterium]